MVGTEDLNVGRHVVQFYGRDEELAGRVTGYLLGALDGGGAASGTQGNISGGAAQPGGPEGEPTTPTKGKK